MRRLGKLLPWQRIPRDLGFTLVSSMSSESDAAKWLLEAVQSGDVQVQEIIDSHNAAVEVLNHYGAELEPFGLFLRSFDLEALRSPSRSRLAPGVNYLEVVNPPSLSERVLIESLGDVLSVITVAHPGSRLVRPGDSRLRRLIIEDDDWRSVVMEIVARAAFVAVDAVELSPGLRDELEALATSNASPRTVIILHDRGSEASQQLAFQEDLARMLGGPGTAYARLGEQEAALGAFTRVIPIGKLAETELDRTPQFADLLFDARYIRSLEPSARRRRNDALATGDRGAELAYAGNLEEAALAYVSALEVLVELDDVTSIVAAATDLPFITAALGDAEKTRESVEWLLRYSRKLSETEREGLLHRLGGVTELPTLLESLQEAELLKELRAVFVSLHT
jgi:tetratricopeptide (TPR) repeat protein